MVFQRSKASLLAIACLCATAEALRLPDEHVLQAKKRGGFPLRPLPFAGNGTCEEAKTENGYTSVRCLGPEQPLLPGTTLDAYLQLESPYPVDRRVVAIKQEAQMVAKTGPNSWRPVPLSELYFHHVVPNPRFLLGEGAEVRGSRLRKPLTAPHAFIINGTEANELDTRITNIQLVNTVGVPAKYLQAAYECWCGTEFGHNATQGSLRCCTQRYTESREGYTIYQLEYNVTYRELREEDEGISFFGFDTTGGAIEYNIVDPLGPNTNHTQAVEQVFDHQCPQNNTMHVVRCTAHQHIGSKCMHVYNVETGEKICSSCPTYGQVKDEPGNELGYVVAIQDDDPSPPYKIEPGTKVRVESVYDGSQKRLGVMGIMAMWVAGASDDCYSRNGSRPTAAVQYEAPVSEVLLTA